MHIVLRVAVAALLLPVLPVRVHAQDAPTTLQMRDNPYPWAAAAPARLAYDPPRERIVQIGLTKPKYYDERAPLLDKIKQGGPWTLKRKKEKLNEVAFVYPDGSKRKVTDGRAIPPNAYGLPDLGAGPYAAEIDAGEVSLQMSTLTHATGDPDWARWIAGRYTLVSEHERGADLRLRIAARGDGTRVEGPVETDLPDGFVRREWTIEAPNSVTGVTIVVRRGNARAWRRLNLYQTHAYPERTGGDLVPTGDREREEAGFIWTRRYLALFADRYNAIRMLGLLGGNQSAEVRLADRPPLEAEGPWGWQLSSMAYMAYPWDAARHLLGEWGGGMPFEASLRTPFEASLVGRELGREGHVVNPQVFVPQHAEGDDLDGYLDAIASHVAWAEARDVEYDYVKIAVGNEVWNTSPGSFRQDHQFFLGYPKSGAWRTNEHDDGPTREAQDERFAALEPWYMEWDDIDASAVRTNVAMRAQARRLVQILSRAHARHPEVNWIGEISAFTARPEIARFVFMGAREGAADVEAWAATGDPYTGSRGYAVVPKDASGQYEVGGLFTYSLTTYWQLKGGPRGQPWRFGGVTEEEAARRLEEGSFNAAMLDRFLSLPAKPADKTVDNYSFSGSLAGMRAKFEQHIAAVTQEGGALLDFYEGSDHTTDSKKWPPTTRRAAIAFQTSAEHAAIQDAIHDVAIELGFLGVADLSHTGEDIWRGKPRWMAPWNEEVNPYATEPWETIWAKHLVPLAPPSP